MLIKRLCLVSVSSSYVSISVLLLSSYFFGKGALDICESMSAACTRGRNDRGSLQLRGAPSILQQL